MKSIVRYSISLICAFGSIFLVSVYFRVSEWQNVFIDDIISLSEYLVRIEQNHTDKRSTNRRYPFLKPNDEYLLDRQLLLKSRNQVKTIIIWSTYFGMKTFAQQPLIEVKVNGQKRICFVTSNNSYLDVADALWFHGVNLNDFNRNKPQQRLPNQRWVVESMEPPTHHSLQPSTWLALQKASFNWSMTYTRWADVYYPFGTLKVANEKVPGNIWAKKWAAFSESFSKRQVNAIFIASDNHIFQSRRFDVVASLIELGVSVDVFGYMGVSGVMDKQLAKLGERQFMSKYQFFFAFENSLCDDYLTEKSYHALYLNYVAGLIPIVHGSGNYSTILPKGSYINTQDFATVTQLADKMKRLAKSKPSNDSELLSYYRWQADFNPLYVRGRDFFDDGSFSIFQSYEQSFDRLCQRLWAADEAQEGPSVVDDIRKHFGNKCYDIADGYFDVNLPQFKNATQLSNYFIERYNERHKPP